MGDGCLAGMGYPYAMGRRVDKNGQLRKKLLVRDMRADETRSAGYKYVVLHDCLSVFQ